MKSKWGHGDENEIWRDEDGWRDVETEVSPVLESGLFYFCYCVDGCVFTVCVFCIPVHLISLHLFRFITLCDSSIYRCPGCLFKRTVPCWPQRGEREWRWVWPRCELLPSLCRNIYSSNSSPPLPHSCALPPLPPPSLPSSSSSTLSWSCPSQSSKPLDPGSCSGCSG